MIEIKLNAIDSTNDFLKSLSNNQILENLTVVTAEHQIKGRGQMGSSWNSESGKNLIMSILILDFITNVNQIFALNIVVSVAVIQALEELNIPELTIKWPNDIMSSNKKVGGILIENTIKSDGSICSVAGLGLNVNQINFPNLPKASSLALICNTDFDKGVILRKIVLNVEKNIQNWNQNADLLWDIYTNKLFKIGIPMPFVDKNQNNFMGVIKGVSPTGKLEIILENDSVCAFDIKQIKMLF